MYARAEATAKTEEAIIEVQAALHVLMQRQDEVDAHKTRCAFSVSDCQFDAEDLANLDALLNSPDFGNTNAGKLFHESQVCPPPPSDAEAASLSKLPTGGTEEDGDAVKPAWLSMVCQSRDFLSDSVLVVCSEENHLSYFLFVYAKQQPRQVACVPLQPMEHEEIYIENPLSGGGLDGCTEGVMGAQVDCGLEEHRER